MSPQPSSAAFRVRSLQTSKLGRHPSRGLTSLDELVEEIAARWPLRPIAAQVLQIAERGSYSAHVLVPAISSDPAIAACVLRVANSSFTGFPRRIATVRDAVVMLGAGQVRAIALAASVMRTIPEGKTISGAPFWRHSAAAAVLAESLAAMEEQEPEDAFLAGALHNIGRLALDLVRPMEFARALHRAQHEGISLAEAQRRTLGFTDAEVGGALALRWGISGDVSLAIARHSHHLEQLCSSQGLARTLVGALSYASAGGLSDGVADPAGTPPAPASIAAWFLDEQCGLDTAIARADSFVECSVPIP